MDDIPLENVIEMMETVLSFHRVDENHGQRTAVLAVRLGKLLDGPQELNLHDLEMLGYSARVHDFGRVGVSNDLISKVGNLTESQRGAIERHPQIGYEMSHILPMAMRLAILHHHENWDGSGYPRGLSGTAIPLLARIIRPVDVWDALNSDRPYRRAYPPDIAWKVLMEMRHCFDPHLLDLIIENRELFRVPG